MEKLPKVTLRVILKYLILVSFGILLVGYTLFQARAIITGPVVKIINSKETVQNERVVDIEGVASNIVKITLNDRVIYTDKNGYFKEALVLENGYTIATLKGTDRYGRETTEIQTFVYQPLATSTNQE